MLHNPRVSLSGRRHFRCRRFPNRYVPLRANLAVRRVIPRKSRHSQSNEFGSTLGVQAHRTWSTTKRSSWVRQLVSDHTIASRATFTVHRMAPPGRSLPFGWSSSGGVRTQFSADYPHQHEHCHQEHARQPASPIRLLVLHRRPPQMSRGRTRRTPGADCRAPQNTYAAFNAANTVRSASAAVNRRNMAAGAARGGRGGTTATRDSGNRTPILRNASK